MLAPRALGAVRLSPLTFGSMRLNERALDDRAWDALLRWSIDRGITAIHSSTEYESFARLCLLLAGLRGQRLQHIVKLAEPHFGDAGFSESRLRSKVDGYLRALDADRIDVVQWMWRGDLKDEPARLGGYANQLHEIAAAFERLRREGKIVAVAPFPYTGTFADAVIDSGTCEGLAIYINPLEHELDAQAARAAARGMTMVAIRPLAAGKAVESTVTATDCVRAVLGHPGVCTAVVSYSTIDHARELVTAASA